MSLTPRLFAPWRRSFQIILSILFVITPFINFRGDSAARLDIPTLTLYLAGIGFRIEELYILLIFIFWLIFLFLLITLVLGRVWCGWLCPQTIVADLADFFGRKPSSKEHILLSNLIKHLLYLAVSIIIGSTFVGYFIKPHFWQQLWQGSLGIWPTGTAIIISTVLYLDFAFIRRLFCRDFCPYGRFQTVLVDKGTLTLQAPPSQLSRCIECKSCVKVCPTGIDIRNGYQIECINCARCLDACRKVMAKRNQPAIIQYTVGLQNKGIKALLNIKTASLLMIVLILGGSLIYSTSHRATASLKIARSQIKSHITDNRQITFYEGSIANFKNDKITLQIVAEDKGGTSLTIKGITSFTLAKRQKVNISFAIITPLKHNNNPQAVLFLLKDNKDVPLQQIQGFY